MGDRHAKIEFNCLPLECWRWMPPFADEGKDTDVVLDHLDHLRPRFVLLFWLDPAWCRRRVRQRAGLVNYIGTDLTRSKHTVLARFGADAGSAPSVQAEGGLKPVPRAFSRGLPRGTSLRARHESSDGGRRCRAMSLDAM